MKIKIYLFLILFVVNSGLQAQTLKDALTHIYYQRFSSAKSVLLQLLQDDPGQTEAAYQLGEIYLSEKKPDSAKQVLQRVSDYVTQNELSKKQHPFPFIGLAHILLNENRRAEADQLIDELLTLTKKKDPAVLLAVSRAHIESVNGDPVYALQLLALATKKDKHNPAIYTAMGDAYRKMVDGSNAVPKYDMAIAADPSFAEAMYKKGLIYSTQKNTEVAVDRFSKAYAMDSAYAPAIYELYYYYLSRDLKTAGKFLNAYLRFADPSPSHEYMLTDYSYLSGNYKDAISRAHELENRDGDDLQPRIYKLLAYSYAAIEDTAKAWNSMTTYFQQQPVKNRVAPDYDFMAKLSEKMSTDQQEVIQWYTQALTASSDEKVKMEYRVVLAEKYKNTGQREKEAEWREKVFRAKAQPGNLDIYNWGVALFSAGKYTNADSVFSLYQEKYPDQIYGYLWRARCNAILDSTMELGLAVPFYQQLVQVAVKDSIKNKRSLLSAYGYLGAYEANITKNFPVSLDYFERILRLDPDQKEAEKYASILREWINASASDVQPDN
jgi:tetratricopeptide (TPR) repeat protein